MTFFISNNTTYNYSYYATRPKWLIESLLKEPLSQRELETNDSYSKQRVPINKVVLVPWSQKLKSQRDNEKKQNTNLDHLKMKDSQGTYIQQTQTKNQTVTLQRSKVLPSTRLGKLFQTKELLCWTSDLSFFSLRGYFSNILKVLQICRFVVRNNKKILFVKSSSSTYGQGKALSPWLVQYKRNTVPTKISNLFNKSYLSPASNQQLISPQILSFKKNRDKRNQRKKDLHRIISTPTVSLQQENSKGELNDKQQIFVKDSLKAGIEKHSNKLGEAGIPENTQSDPASYSRRYYQLNSLLNDCLIKGSNFGENYNNKNSYFKNRFLFSSHFNFKNLKNQRMVPWESVSQPNQKGPLSKIKNKQKKMLLFVDPYLKNPNDSSQEQGLKNPNKYRQIPKKETVRIDNIIKCWVKDAQTMSQQTAAGLTIPLAGFLTNSKTTFDVIYNLSNENAYSSINPKSYASNALLNRGACEIATNRLKNIHFQKSVYPFSLVLPKHQQDKHSQLSNKFDQFLALPFTTTKIKENHNGLKTKNPVKSLRYRISQKQIGQAQENGLEKLALSFPRLFENWKFTSTKRVTKSKKKNVSIANPTGFLKNQKAQDFRQKEWWTQYSNSHHYLALAKNTQGDGERITCSKKTKKPKPLEYCFFGDVFTWQPKSQKSSSMFYLNPLSSKSKENIMFYLKKKVTLEKREPIILKRKKPPFFTHFKKQLQRLKSPKLNQLKELLNSLPYNPWQRQTKCSFLRKKQFLSTLAKFIVFYFNDRSVLFKKPTKQVKSNQTYISLPAFSTIKRYKVNLNSRNFSRNFEKYNHKQHYRYNIAFNTLERILNLRYGTKGSPFLSSEIRAEGSKKKRLFGAFAQKDQKAKKPLRKNNKLRPTLYYKYYKTIIALNYFNQYKMFTKTPFVNNGLPDIIFFTNPEKNQNLVNQANCLKIPTVGIISGNMASTQGRQGIDNFRLKDSVYYPILGNPMSSFFTRAIINLIVKFLRVEKSKKKSSKE